MLIDCQTCIAPASACRDCVVTFLLERPPLLDRGRVEEKAERPIELDEAERAAVDSLVAAGLVPPLRLVSGLTPDSSGNGREIA